MVKDLVKPGGWLAKIDLKDVYFLVPVHPSYKKFHQFQWQDSLYQFQCLPFGLSCAPRTLTKLIKPVVALLLVLTRPCRGADLAALDFRNRSYVPEGVVFQSCHLSKQSRPLHHGTSLVLKRTSAYVKLRP